MPIPSAITDLSTTPGSNSPSGSEAPTEGDNHLRTAYAFIRQLYDAASVSSAAAAASLAAYASNVASAGTATVGAGLVGFNPTLNYVAGTIGARLKERVSVKDFPWLAKGDSNGTTGNGTDDTAALNACFLYALTNGMEVFVPPGIYRTTSALNITKGVRIVGSGTHPYDGAVGTPGLGSWFFFDHTGKGFNIVGAASAIQSTVTLAHLGTRRVQPAPGGGWAPTVYDFDIYIDNTDVLLEDIMLLNPSHGVQLVNGNAGRLRTRDLRGQPFVVGVDFVYSADSPEMTNTRFWPFWKDDSDVHAYTLANLDAVKFGRCDNPMIANFFCIFARSGMRFYQNAFGRTSKVRAVNVDFDRGLHGIWVDTTVTDGITGQFTNVTHQGEANYSGSKFIWVQGDDSNLDFENIRSDRCYANGIRVEGTGNLLKLGGNVSIYNYDHGNGGFPGIEAAAGNIARILDVPTMSTTLGSGARYGGSGLIYVDEWRSYSPTYSTGTGSITTMGTTSAYYKLWADKVSYRIDATITTNGTGATNFRATLPYAQAASTPNSTGHGREVAATGHALTATLSAGSATLIIQKYDNTYPGGDGRRICVEGEFPV